jgi:hypothetical protein
VRRRGQTLIELCILLLALAIAIAGATGGGLWFGPAGAVLGGPIAVAGAYGIILLIALLEDLFWGGIPRIPTCRNGTCEQGSYSWTRINDGRWVLQCGCGLRYEKTGRRFAEIDEVGASRPYLEWVPFVGWRAERGKE